jgi:hypothetical protein
MRNRLKKWFILAAILSVSLACYITDAASTSKEAATSGTADPRIMGKLDQIIENQQKMLGEFEEVKRQLQIIKIRATTR